MKQLNSNIATVMEYLKAEGFSPSVISEHRLCYKELYTFLVTTGKDYAPEIAYQWIDAHETSWGTESIRDIDTA